jgi:hypothetical protein
VLHQRPRRDLWLLATESSSRLTFVAATLPVVAAVLCRGGRSVLCGERRWRSQAARAWRSPRRSGRRQTGARSRPWRCYCVARKRLDNKRGMQAAFPIGRGHYGKHRGQRPKPATEITPDFETCRNFSRMRRWLVLKATESNMAQPGAALMRLISFSTGVGRRVSKSSNFAHRGSTVIRTIC